MRYGAIGQRVGRRVGFSVGDKLNHWDSRQWIGVIAVLMVMLVAITPLLVLIADLPFAKIIINHNVDWHWTLFLHSMVLCGVVAIVSSLLGACLAYGFSFLPDSWRWIFIILLTLPLFIPSYIHAFNWNQVFILLEVKANTATGANLFTFDGFKTGLVLCVSYFAIPTLLMSSTLLRWDRRFQEAAWLHCRHPRQRRKIYIRYFFPPMLVGFVLVYVLSFSNFAVPDFFQVPVYATEIFIQMTSYKSLTTALSASLLPVGFGLFILGVTVLLTKQIRLYSSTRHTQKARHRSLSSFKQRAAVSVLIIILLFVVVLPFSVLISRVDSFVTISRVVSMAWHDTLYSLIFAIVTALLCTLFAFLLGVITVRQYFPGFFWFRLLLLMLFILPVSFHGIGLINLWNRSGWMGLVYDSGVLVSIGLTIYWLPIAYEMMMATLKQVSPRQDEAAYMIGNTWLTMLYQILFPQLWRPLLVIFFVVMVFSFNELGLTLLLTPPGVSSLPVRIFSFVHYGSDKLMAAMCLWQIIVLIVPLSIMYWVLWRLNIHRRVE